ncbi:monooxygenase, FAD-binding protein [Minicystis rosea]|nr:monooxygenase, FAD-binding protein [Minicystis rosea]
MGVSADVLVAGGGVAGAALAVLLGRRGVRVDLFEQRRYPSEKPCGEGIMPGGVAVLERLALLDAIGGERFSGIRWHAGDLVAEARFPCASGERLFGVAQRRLRLDGVLFEAAQRTAGVRAFEGVRVDAPLVEGGRVVGLVAGGEARRAPLVVIADGAGSKLRGALGLAGSPARHARVGVRAHFGGVADRLAADRVEVFLHEGHELYVTRLPGGEAMVAALSDRLAVGVDLKAALHRWIAAEPGLRDHLAGAPVIGAVAGRYPLAGRARAGVVPGAVLLGDAAGWTDPVTGGGIAQALLAAELLADHVPFALAYGDAWLGRFDRRRRRLLRDQRWLTAVTLELVARPRLVRPVLRGFAAWPGLFSHFIGVAAGARPLF